jgi:hypothetical protein
MGCICPTSRGLCESFCRYCKGHYAFERELYFEKFVITSFSEFMPMNSSLIWDPYVLLADSLDNVDPFCIWFSLGL